MVTLTNQELKSYPNEESYHIIKKKCLKRNVLMIKNYLKVRDLSHYASK